MKQLCYLLFILVLAATPCAPALATSTETPSLVPLRLMLQWLPQAQFAGYYMAQEQGFYRQQGLDLTIIAGGPGKIVSKELDSGNVDFGMLFLAAALERHAAGVPIVNVGQIVQHSSLMLIARAQDGITDIADLDGKKVALWANEFQTQPRMLFKSLDMQVEIIPQTNSLALFLHHAVSATCGMWYNEYHSLLASGLRTSELQPFFFRDTPYDFPEDGLYCLASTLEKNPAVAKKLLLATVMGWQYAFEHEEETLDLVAQRMQEANLPVNRVHQRWMLQRMRDILLTDEQLSPDDCILNEENFRQIVANLIDSKVFQTPIDYATFYRGPLQ
ncbi:MAG: ABC transporter substrate-binding protein [Desulfuromonas sp.]|nr:ABC transporter substrate-binding protein [Desulfuromonas sp.]